LRAKGEFKDEDAGTTSKHQIGGKGYIRTISMAYRHANVEQDVRRNRVLKDLSQRFPAMQIDITLEEVIQTPVTGDFQLWADTESA
jgi:hypothetical protein